MRAEGITRHLSAGVPRGGEGGDEGAPPKDAARNLPPTNQFWWPERLDLAPLRQHAAESDPMGPDFEYAAAFKKLDLRAVKKDLELRAAQQLAG